MCVLEQIELRDVVYVSRCDDRFLRRLALRPLRLKFHRLASSDHKHGYLDFTDVCQVTKQHTLVVVRDNTALPDSQRVHLLTQI